MITIHVLAAGELFQHVLNAVATFTNMKNNGFLGLLSITSFIGIVMASIGFLKTRDPMVFGRWFLGYVFFMNLVCLPKTSVLIDDISAQQTKLVDNVPVVFAMPASLVTTIGYGLAQNYDALLSMPNDLQYTQTGALFGSRLITAATSFRIIDPMLKEEMNEYFRVCVVGDIRINHKYSVGDLANSTDIWSFISNHASPLRMIQVNGKEVTCLEASSLDGDCSLSKKLDAEIKKAYSFFGVNLFGKPCNTTYENLFTTQLTSAFKYYQHLTDTTGNIILQTMMINAMKDGIGYYQAFTDATAGVINQQFTKSQVQHRWSWEVLGQKALWILPITHTCLTVLLFGVFPLILALSTLPGGVRILYGYLQFFMSLQFWPVLFAILNAGMTLYGASNSSEYGQFTMVNLDKMDELHADIAGVCGYLMMLIPFLSRGLVSNLGEAFSNLATSMMSHMQGSSMSVAGEAASASFGLGQTSFYNTSANNFSANKHDSNWTHMSGMHTEQLGTGVLKTITGSGETVFDVSPGMSKSHIHIADSAALTGSLNQAFEESNQAASNENKAYQSALSNFAHRALQLSQLTGHDMRLSSGVSSSDSAQFSNSLSTMSRIAKDVAHRNGISQEDAFAAMTSGGHGISAGIDAQKSIAGKILGIKGGWSARLKYDRSSTNANRSNESYDKVVSAHEAEDFHEARNIAQQFLKTHHFDDSHSKASSLSNQLGTDLREAETASHNYDVSHARAMRISDAKHYVETKGEQITAELNQAFPAFVASKVGTPHRDELFANPGDMNSIQELQGLASEFIDAKREQLINQYSNPHEATLPDRFYQNESQKLKHKDEEIGLNYQKNSANLTTATKNLNIEMNPDAQKALLNQVDKQMADIKDKQSQGINHVQQVKNERFSEYKEKKEPWEYKAMEGVIPGHTVDKGWNKIKETVKGDE